MRSRSRRGRLYSRTAPPCEEPLRSSDRALGPYRCDATVSWTNEYGIPQAGQAARYDYVGSAERKRDVNSGLMLMGQRVYNPGSGRFLQADPVLGGSANSYDYVAGDPVNSQDVGGESTYPAGCTHSATNKPTVARYGIYLDSGIILKCNNDWIPNFGYVTGGTIREKIQRKRTCGFGIFSYSCNKTLGNEYTVQFNTEQKYNVNAGFERVIEGGKHKYRLAWRVILSFSQHAPVDFGWAYSSWYEYTE